MRTTLAEPLPLDARRKRLQKMTRKGKSNIVMSNDALEEASP